MPCESRRVTPIWDGVRPLRASLMMCSTTSSGVVLSQVGGARRYGRAEEAGQGCSGAILLCEVLETYRCPFRARACDPWFLNRWGTYELFWRATTRWCKLSRMLCALSEKVACCCTVANLIEYQPPCRFADYPTFVNGRQIVLQHSV
jgi:hypothetical protein